VPARRIFLSYRREDTAGEAGRLSDRLASELGADSVFMDVDGIPLGTDFVKRLTAEVASCDVLLAVIGPQWLDITDERGNRRLDDSNDFVRVEVAAALQRDIPVIPILLDGTRIPRVDRLPADLKDLAVREGLEVRHSSFHNDVNRLVLQLRKMSSTSNHDSAPTNSSSQNPQARYQGFIGGAVAADPPVTSAPTTKEPRGGWLASALSSARRAPAVMYALGLCAVLALTAASASMFKSPCQWAELFGKSGCAAQGQERPAIEPVYTTYSSPELGVMIIFPNNILTLDTTEREQRQLILKDGNGQQVVKILRTALAERKDVKIAREDEVIQLKKMNFSLTYVAPEKEKNWSNWYVLSGVSHGTEFYFRRWYCPDSVVSIEFMYDKSVSPLFDGIIAKMTQQFVMTNCA
jgi:hypothetical protein